MLKKVDEKIGNGSMTIDLGWRGAWRKLTFYGGPFNRFPGEGFFGVCVRAESVPKTGVDLHLPIVDFQVPTSNGKTAQVVQGTIKAAIDGKKPYVGCMGGWGRTGLVLALIAKAAGEDDPVDFVRKNYASHAVETLPQLQFVNNFDVTELRRTMYRDAWISRIPMLSYFLR